MPDALRGRTIVVTRPAAQAADLIAAIAAQGGTALPYPLIEIEPLAADAIGQAAAAGLGAASLAIFVSPNAVRFGLAPLRGRWPPRLAVAAVGQGTARALAEAGFADVVVPSAGADSEALLAHPALAAPSVAGRDILLFKGEGGRPLLADALAERGARVRNVVCYRRLPPALPPAVLLDAAGGGGVDAIVVTSSEALGNLEALFGPARRELLLDQLMVAAHPRIADAALRRGFRRVLATAPGDAAVIAALTSYNWSNPSPDAP